MGVKRRDHSSSSSFEVKKEWSYVSTPPYLSVLHKDDFTLSLRVPSDLSFFRKSFIAQTVHTVCTRIDYRIVPVTILNKYLHYGTSGTE